MRGLPLRASWRVVSTAGRDTARRWCSNCERGSATLFSRRRSARTSGSPRRRRSASRSSSMTAAAWAPPITGPWRVRSSSKRKDGRRMAQRRKTTIGRNPLDTVQDARPAPEDRQPASPDEVDTDAAGRRWFAAWVTGAEDTLRVTFDVQNAALKADVSIMDAAAVGQRGFLDAWRRAAEQAQQSTLEAFRSSV